MELRLSATEILTLERREFEMQCVNLRERFGDLLKVRYEESYHAERGEDARAEDPWLMALPCQRGEICPWGGSDLAACTKTAGSVAKRLKALPFAQTAQDGDDGANVVFPVEHFEEVAIIMKPRKRRRLSPEARLAAGERLQKYQFQPAVGSPNSTLECDPTPAPV